MAPKISSKQWEECRPKISQLYINEDKQLDAVMALMKQQGFNATKSQYTTKLKAWNLLKNNNQIPAQVWKYVDREKGKRKRDNRGDDVEVIIDGVVQPPAKVRKETSRHFFTTQDEWNGSASSPKAILVSVCSPETTAPEINTTFWSPNMSWLRFSAQFPQINGDYRDTDHGGMWTLPELGTDLKRHISSLNVSNLKVGSTELFSISSIFSGQRKSVRRLAADMAIFMPGSLKVHLQRSQALLKGRPGISLRPLLGVLIFRVSNNMGSVDDWNAVFTMIREFGWMKSSKSELSELRSTEPTILAFWEKLFQKSFKRDDWDFISWLLDIGVPPDTRVGTSSWVFNRHLILVAALGEGFEKQISSSMRLERYQLLLRYGASPAVWCCEVHQTPVHHAFRLGRLEVVQLHDLRERWDHQELMYEAVNCSEDAAGAQVMQHLVRVHNLSSRASEDVFTRARTAEVLNKLTYFNCKTMLQLLSNHGADFNCHVYDGDPRHADAVFPLGVAVLDDDESTCRLLLRLGALVNYDPGTRSDGLIRPSVLHLVKSEEICKILLESGANNHNPAQVLDDERPMTPLCIAVRRGRYTCARLLAQHDPQLENQKLLSELRDANDDDAPDFLTVLEAIHDRHDLSPTFRQEVASMAYTNRVLHSIKQEDIRDIDKHTEEGLLRVISHSDYATLLMKAVRWRRFQILDLMLGKVGLVNLAQQAELLDQAFKTGCCKIIDHLLVVFPDAYSSSALCAVICRLTRNASGAGYQLGFLLQRRRRLDNIEVKQETKAISLAVRHAAITGDFGVLDKLNPNASINFCCLTKCGKPYWIPALVPSLYHHEGRTSELVLRRDTPSRNPGTLEILLDKGYKCCTFLGHLAVELGLLDHLKLLVANGFNPSRRYAWASTVLQCAVRKRDVTMVCYLLHHGADVNARPSWRRQISFGGFGEHLLFPPYEIPPPRTALQSAAENGDLEMVQLLLAHKANVNAAPGSRQGGTALQLACIQGFTGIAKLLLSEGAEPNAPKAKVHGRTALEGAAEHGRLDTVDLLLNEGCQVNGSYRKAFISAVRLATEEAHTTVAKRLRDFGDWTSEDEREIEDWEESDEDLPVELFSDDSDVSDIENPSDIAMSSFDRSEMRYNSLVDHMVYNAWSDPEKDCDTDDDYSMEM